MPTHSLPERPNLRHLKDQARDLVRSGEASSLAQAQFEVARRYGFPSWTKLKAHVDSLQEAGRLKDAIDNDDIDRVVEMMTRNPELHRAPIGYGKDGPLTWAAECRYEPPSGARLKIARWLIENGSDVHQGGDGPLGRAALNGDRIPMMELLVEYGADVNAVWRGWFPIIFSACEAVDPVSLRWLLEHGANPDCRPVSALDYQIEAYWRTPKLAECIEILVAAGAKTKYDEPAVLELLSRHYHRLAAMIDEDPSLISRRFPGLHFGQTGERRLLLGGGTLLHVAAEYCDPEAARLLLDRGADVNARGGSGETPLFHAATQLADKGLETARVLIARGADLSVRATLPGHYERPEEFVDCTALEYALRFPGGDSRTVELLRSYEPG